MQSRGDFLFDLVFVCDSTVCLSARSVSVWFACLTCVRDFFLCQQLTLSPRVFVCVGPDTAPVGQLLDFVDQLGKTAESFKNAHDAAAKEEPTLQVPSRV